jgi:hypothetical protein
LKLGIDLFSGDRHKQANSVFLNSRNGKFADVSSAADAVFATPRAHRGAIVTDFDGDGKLDGVVSVLGERRSSGEIRHPAQITGSSSS